MVLRAVIGKDGTIQNLTVVSGHPMLVDAVVMYAQRGSGRRSSFYSDYTFGLWQDGELSPIGGAAKVGASGDGSGEALRAIDVAAELRRVLA